MASKSITATSSSPAKITKGKKKEEIKSVIETQSEELASIFEEKFDPQLEVKEKKKKEILDVVKSFNVDDVTNTINSLQNFANEVVKLTNVYNNLEEAIKLKEAELKETFDIEVSSFTLAALHNAHQNELFAFEERISLKKTELFETQDQIKTESVIARQSWMDEKAKADISLKEHRQKEAEEYKYNFERQKKLAQDKLNDELSAERREFEQAVSKSTDTLNTRESNLCEREAKCAEIEKKLAEMSDKLATIEADTTAKVSAREKKSYEFEVRILKNDHTGKLELANSKIETLTLQLAEEKARVKSLELKQDEALNKVEAIAKSSVEGASKAYARNNTEQQYTPANANKQ